MEACESQQQLHDDGLRCGIVLFFKRLLVLSYVFCVWNLSAAMFGGVSQFLCICLTYELTLSDSYTDPALCKMRSFTACSVFLVVRLLLYIVLFVGADKSLF